MTEHFNSRDKDKFVVGKEYYTFYFSMSNNGTTLRDYTGIMKVKVTSNEPSEYSPKGYTRFEIIKSKKLGSTLAHNIHFYMNGYGIASCDFYETKEDCIKCHDLALVRAATGQSTEYRDRILKKVKNKNTIPGKDNIEIKSLEWYNSLPKSTKKYVQWIKEYYDGEL